MVGRFVVALLLAGVAGWSFYYYHYLGEPDPFNRKGKKPTSLIDPLMLPIFIICSVVLTLFLGGGKVADEVARMFLGLFLYISLYFLLLMCLLPLLRRWISARACATLWILPNMLYIMGSLSNFGKMEPLILIPLPGSGVQRLLVTVWLAGFGVVLLWQVISHLRFRRQLLENTWQVEAAVWNQWVMERSRAGIERSIPIFYSDAVRTPVTVGCFLSTVILVLPGGNYAPEELELIFRHELQHIGRLDMRTKVFFAFCTAMCWFNPLMWIARRKASEDLELSCDEEVLKEADEATRRRYAELLLQTAGDSRGFSTCLSAGANSMRYRLKNVVAPRRKLAGAVCVTVSLFALLMGSNAIAFAEGGGTVAELIFDRYPQTVELLRITVRDWDKERRGYRSVYGWQEEDLIDYVGSLRVRQVHSSGYSQEEPQRLLMMEYEPPKEVGFWDGWSYLNLSDGLLGVNIPCDDEGGNLIYLVEKEIDWAYVESLLDFNAKAPDPPPEIPRWMQAEFSGEGMEKIRLDVSGKLLGGVRSGETIEPGTYVTDPSYSSISGSPATQVKLLFPHEPAGYEVLVRNWEESAGYSLDHTQLEGDVLPLANYSAHYTVYVQFALAEDTVYEMAYFFDVELPET